MRPTRSRCRGKWNRFGAAEDRWTKPAPFTTTARSLGWTPSPTESATRCTPTPSHPRVHLRRSSISCCTCSCWWSAPSCWGTGRMGPERPSERHGCVTSDRNAAPCSSCWADVDRLHDPGDRSSSVASPRDLLDERPVSIDGSLVPIRYRDIHPTEEPGREEKGASICTAVSDPLCLCVCFFVRVFSLSYYAKDLDVTGKWDSSTP